MYPVIYSTLYFSEFIVCRTFDICSSRKACRFPRRCLETNHQGFQCLGSVGVTADEFILPGQIQLSATSCF